MFNVGDKIAHPLHGAGIISGIEERIIDGVARQYYVLSLPVGGMVVMIPMDNTGEIGIRPIIDAEQADRIIASLPDIDTTFNSNWNKRYRENMLRIKSGDLNEVARVIKSLTERDNERGLSNGEWKMLHFAKQILISEIVLSKSADYDEIEQCINAALA
jgi:CarD family transcriptional regulator